MGPIINEVQTIIDKIAEEEGYDIIISSLQILAYVSENVKKNHDLTKRVIEEMGGNLPGSNSKSN